MGQRGLYIYSGYKNASKSVGGVAQNGKAVPVQLFGARRIIEICGSGGKNETAGPGPLNGAAQMYRKPWER